MLTISFLTNEIGWRLPIGSLLPGRLMSIHAPLSAVLWPSIWPMMVMQGIDLFDRTGLQRIDFLTQFPFHFGGHGFEFVQDVVELTLTAEQPHAELFDLRRSLRFELFNPFEQVVYFLNHLYCWLFFRYIYTL